MKARALVAAAVAAVVTAAVGARAAGLAVPVPVAVGRKPPAGRRVAAHEPEEPKAAGGAGGAPRGRRGCRCRRGRGTRAPPASLPLRLPREAPPQAEPPLRRPRLIVPAAAAIVAVAAVAAAAVLHVLVPGDNGLGERGRPLPGQDDAPRVRLQHAPQRPGAVPGSDSDSGSGSDSDGGTYTSNLPLLATPVSFA